VTRPNNATLLKFIIGSLNRPWADLESSNQHIDSRQRVACAKTFTSNFAVHQRNYLLVHWRSAIEIDRVQEEIYHRSNLAGHASHMTGPDISEQSYFGMCQATLGHSLTR
jgi:hypothetical protein